MFNGNNYLLRCIKSANSGLDLHSLKFTRTPSSSTLAAHAQAPTLPQPQSIRSKLKRKLNTTALGVRKVMRRRRKSSTTTKAAVKVYTTLHQHIVNASNSNCSRISQTRSQTRSCGRISRAFALSSTVCKSLRSATSSSSATTTTTTINNNNKNNTMSLQRSCMIESRINTDLYLFSDDDFGNDYGDDTDDSECDSTCDDMSRSLAANEMSMSSVSSFELDGDDDGDDDHDCEFASDIQQPSVLFLARPVMSLATRRFDPIVSSSRVNIRTTDATSTASSSPAPALSRASFQSQQRKASMRSTRFDPCVTSSRQSLLLSASRVTTSTRYNHNDNDGSGDDECSVCQHTQRHAQMSNETRLSSLVSAQARYLDESTDSRDEADVNILSSTHLPTGGRNNTTLYSSSSSSSFGSS